MDPLSRVSKMRIASPVWSGLVWSCIWLGIGALALSLLLAGNAVPEADLVPWVFGVHGFAALAGGFVAARRAGQKGWYFGAANGALYTLAVVLTSFLAADTEWSIRIAMLLGLTVLTGALGGMLGVNTGSSKSRR
jgi:putative membrane protein (TIGR04086 family)